LKSSGSSVAAIKTVTKFIQIRLKMTVPKSMESAGDKSFGIRNDCMNPLENFQPLLLVFIDNNTLMLKVYIDCLYPLTSFTNFVGNCPSRLVTYTKCNLLANEKNYPAYHERLNRLPKTKPYARD